MHAARIHSVCEQIRLQDMARIVNAEYSSGVLGHLFHLQDQVCNGYTFNLTVSST